MLLSRVPRNRKAVRVKIDESSKWAGNEKLFSLKEREKRFDPRIAEKDSFSAVKRLESSLGPVFFYGLKLLNHFLSCKLSDEFVIFPQSPGLCHLRIHNHFSIFWFYFVLSILKINGHNKSSHYKIF